MEIKISIDYPRPLTVLVLVGIVVAFAFSVGSVEAPVQADLRPADGTVFYRNGEAMPQGGPDRTPSQTLQYLRLEQQVLTHKADILKQHIVVLDRGGGERWDAEIYEARKRLLALFQDERALEAAIVQSLREMNDAHHHAAQIAQTVSPSHERVRSFLWPVEPRYGISAGFHDQEYAQRFGFEHQAIDIPIEQGSIIYAAADGVVKEVSDRGLGFNSLVIAHNGGVATLYGHVREFLVSDGQRVRAGDPVATSGGMPGTPGAGMLSTGPHLHFEVIVGGTPIDPLVMLPHRLFSPTWVLSPTEFRARPNSSA